MRVHSSVCMLKKAQRISSWAVKLRDYQLRSPMKRHTGCYPKYPYTICTSTKNCSLLICCPREQIILSTDRKHNNFTQKMYSVLTRKSTSDNGDVLLLLRYDIFFQSQKQIDYVQSRYIKSILHPVWWNHQLNNFSLTPLYKRSWREALQRQMR